MKKILSGLSLLVLSVSLLGVPSASACSCVPPQPPRESLQMSDAVFAGRVLEVSGGADGMNYASRIKTTFDVFSAWKGAELGTVKVFTSGSSASCGYGFEAGKEYIVYAHKAEDGTLETGLCSRTSLLALAQEDLAALGEGKTSEPGNQVENGGEAQPANETLGVGAILFVILAGVYMLSKRVK